jgi:hypothetical protein
MREFEWSSPLGAAVILFTVGAVIHLVVGVLMGVVFQLLPEGTEVGRRYLFLNEGPDRALFGGSPRALLDGDPTLLRFRAIVFTALAGVLVGLGIVELALSWFALKGGQAWALGALAISGLAMLPFFLGAFRPYLAAGIGLGLGDLPPFIWIPAIALVPATFLGWIGLHPV